MNIFTVNFSKDEQKEKEAGNGPFLKIYENVIFRIFKTYLFKPKRISRAKL